VSPPAFASALSRHPVTSQAVGEVVGAVLEEVGERPDLVVVTVTRSHAGALEDVVAVIQALLHPLGLIGCAAESVIGRGAEIEELPGISLWAGQVGPLRTALLSATRRADDSWDVVGWPDDVGFAPTAALVLADPFTFPAGDLCAALADSHPGLPVVGGYASGATGAGGTRLALGDRVRSDGAVAVLLGPATEVVPVVSQGCRPFGRMLTVTRVERNLVLEIAGRPAMECMVDEIAEHLDRADIAGIEGNGLLLGRCVDDTVLEPGPRDLLFRPLLGVERATGALSVEDRVPLGDTVQFAVRDAGTAAADLTIALTRRRADAALLFTCNGRGTRLFDDAHHDARALGGALGPVPLGGMFAAGEFGPVGGANFVHTFAASALLFRERYGPSTDALPLMHDR
jgi:small ligand-binding sensory domain FIST